MVPSLVQTKFTVHEKTGKCKWETWQKSCVHTLWKFGRGTMRKWWDRRLSKKLGLNCSRRTCVALSAPCLPSWCQKFTLYISHDRLIHNVEAASKMGGGVSYIPGCLFLSTSPLKKIVFYVFSVTCHCFTPQLIVEK